MTVVGVRDGAAVTQNYTGYDIRQRFGLLSPGFRVHVAPPQPLAGDWDGDGDDEPGGFRAGRWRLSTKAGAVSFTYGRPGDVAVVGNWDRDRADEIGVFRRGRWLLRDSASDGAVQRNFRFGRIGDKPVVGDWNDNGRSGIGVVRDGRWHLRQTMTAGRPDLTFRYGRATDWAFAGDWNDDGRDASRSRATGGSSCATRLLAAASCTRSPTAGPPTAR